MTSSGVYRVLGMTVTSLVAVQPNMHTGPVWPGQVSIARTMDLLPPDTPIFELSDPRERLKRPWERMGQAIQGSVDKAANEHAAK